MGNKNKNKTKLTSEQLKGWEGYRQSLYLQKTKSDDQFEKAITFISSGALGLTLTFHDKIVPTENARWTFIVAMGWMLLAATLFINLISHYKSSKSTDKSIDEIDQVIDDRLPFASFQNNLLIRNRAIDLLNLWSIWLLGLGIILIIIYVSLNLYYGKAV